MGAFDVEAPNWGRIPPVNVTGAPVTNADGSVTLATDAGPLRVSLLECAARPRLPPAPPHPRTLPRAVRGCDSGRIPVTTEYWCGSRQRCPRAWT